MWDRDPSNEDISRQGYPSELDIRDGCNAGFGSSMLLFIPLLTLLKGKALGSHDKG